MSLWKECVPTLAAAGVVSLRYVAPPDAAWRPSLAVVVAVGTVQAFALLVAVASRCPGKSPPCGSCEDEPEEKADVSLAPPAAAAAPAPSPDLGPAAIAACGVFCLAAMRLLRAAGLLQRPAVAFGMAFLCGGIARAVFPVRGSAPDAPRCRCPGGQDCGSAAGGPCIFEEGFWADAAPAPGPGGAQES